MDISSFPLENILVHGSHSWKRHLSGEKFRNSTQIIELTIIKNEVQFSLCDTISWSWSVNRTFAEKSQITRIQSWHHDCHRALDKAHTVSISRLRYIMKTLRLWETPPFKKNTAWGLTRDLNPCFLKEIVSIPNLIPIKSVKIGENRNVGDKTPSIIFCQLVTKWVKTLTLCCVNIYSQPTALLILWYP